MRIAPRAVRACIGAAHQQHERALDVVLAVENDFGRVEYGGAVCVARLASLTVASVHAAIRLLTAALRTLVAGT